MEEEAVQPDDDWVTETETGGRQDFRLEDKSGEPESVPRASTDLRASALPSHVNTIRNKSRQTENRQEAAHRAPSGNNAVFSCTFSLQYHHRHP